MKKIFLVAIIFHMCLVANVSAVSATGSLKVGGLYLNGSKLCVAFKTTSGSNIFGYLTSTDPNFAFYHTELSLAMKEGYYLSVYWDDSVPQTDWGINYAYKGKWIKAIAVSNAK